MPIQIQLPDGSIGEFPDGMADADIERVLQQQFPTQSAPADFSGVKSRVDSTANDRVAPATDSMSGYEKFMAGVGKSFVDTYEGAKQ